MRGLPLGIAVLAACAHAPVEVAPDPATPRLVWVQGNPEETWEQAQAGLWYQLAHLGATAPPDGGALTVLEDSPERVVFDLDLAGLGWPEGALGAMEAATAPVVDSDEARVFGAVDLGRFLMRTLYDPWRYLAITGACPTLEDWRAVRLQPVQGRFAVTDSLLVDGDRALRFNLDPKTAGDVAFEAEEGEGSLEDGTFDALEHEVVDLMASGAQRYAVYGADGALLPAGTVAGTSGKCMWCHEADLQRTLGENSALPGYLSQEAFLFQLGLAQGALDQERAAQTGAVDFRDARVHAWGERIAETFLAPSVARVAREWGVDEETAGARTEALAVHQSAEYPDGSDLLTRADVDAVLATDLLGIADESDLDLSLRADFSPLAVPPSARDLDEAALAALDSAAEMEASAACSP